MGEWTDGRMGKSPEGAIVCSPARKRRGLRAKIKKAPKGR